MNRINQQYMRNEKKYVPKKAQPGARHILGLNNRNLNLGQAAQLQRQQRAAELKSKLDLAKKIKKNSNNNIEAAEKNYHTFSKGGFSYEKMRAKKASAKTMGKVNNLKKLFSEKTSEIQKLMTIHRQKNEQKKSNFSLQATMAKDTKKLANKASAGLNLKNIHNRMSDFYEEQNQLLEWMLWYITKIYWILVLVGLVLVGFGDNKLLAIFVALIIIPFQLNGLIEYVFNLHSNNCPSYIPSLGFESGGSKTCQVKRAKNPVDCEMGSWTACSKSCGGGMQTRDIEAPPAFGGRPCGPVSQKCNEDSCPPGQSPKVVDKKKNKMNKKKQNVLVQMTTAIWQSFQGRLTGAKQVQGEMIDEIKERLKKQKEKESNLKEEAGDIKKMAALGAQKGTDAVSNLGGRGAAAYRKGLADFKKKEQSDKLKGCPGGYCR